MGWGDWCGTGRISPRLTERMSYEQASAHVRKKGIKSRAQYIEYWKQNRPLLLPSNPDKYYRGRGWKSWSHFLGTHNVKNINWMPFEEARKYVSSLGFKNAKAFFSWCSGKLKKLPLKPPDIPINPHIIYKDKGWHGYGDFLSTGNISTQKINYLEFAVARKEIRKEGFKTKKEYDEFWDAQKPWRLPKCPHQTYKGRGWKNWSDFLGYVRPRREGWRSYKKAKEFVHKLNLKNHKEWIWYCRGEYKGLPKKPADIPFNPYLVYALNGWQGWGVWLGTGNVRKHKPMYRPYAEAESFARKLNLKNRIEWKEYVANKFPARPPKPDDIPSTPDRIYKGSGWVSWTVFLVED